MKISEMSTAELAPVLCDIAEPIGNIAMDAETLSSIREVGEQKTNVEQVGAFTRKIIPLLLKTHFDDMCCIIAALTGKTVETVKAQNGLQTINDAIDSVDGELLDFFNRFMHTEQKK